MKTAIIRLCMLTLLGSALVFVGCSDDAAPGTKDTGNKVSPDTRSPFQNDFGVRPDYGYTPGRDSQAWPDVGSGWNYDFGGTDPYSGAPFGCSVDADCFGRQCCPTPWGVKICADSCGK